MGAADQATGPGRGRERNARADGLKSLSSIELRRLICKIDHWLLVDFVACSLTSEVRMMVELMGGVFPVVAAVLSSRRPFLAHSVIFTNPS